MCDAPTAVGAPCPKKKSATLTVTGGATRGSKMDILRVAFAISKSGQANAGQVELKKGGKVTSGFVQSQAHRRASGFNRKNTEDCLDLQQTLKCREEPII